MKAYILNVSLLTCGQKSPAPVANMVSSAAAPRDPNFAFDAAPATEPKKTPKPQTKIRTPKTRKRARRLGSQVGSEEDDETYTPPVKVKRKRNASRGSAASAHDSGSSKTGEKDNAVSNSASDKTPPTEDRPARRASLTRERQSPYESRNLMKRFKASNQSLNAPNIAKLSQDSLVSPSQTQRTIYVVQEYPEIEEHMHIFLAERQVALMSPTKGSKDRRSPTPPPTEQEPSWQPTSPEESPEVQAMLLKRDNEKRNKRIEILANIAALNEQIPVTQSLVGSSGPTESSYQDMQTDITQASPRINMAERARTGFSPPPNSSGSLFIPSTDSAQSAFSRFSSSDRTPTEQHWGKLRPELIRGNEKNVIEPKSIERVTHDKEPAQTETWVEQTERENEAHTAPSLPTPSYDTPPMAHKQVTAPPPNANTNHHPPPPKPTFQVRYWIIESRLPEYNRVKWLAGGLLAKPMPNICNEIAALIDRPVQRSITVNLKTSEGISALKSHAIGLKRSRSCRRISQRNLRGRGRRGRVCLRSRWSRIRRGKVAWRGGRWRRRGTRKRMWSF